MTRRRLSGLGRISQVCRRPGCPIRAPARGVHGIVLLACPAPMVPTWLKHAGRVCVATGTAPRAQGGARDAGANRRLPGQAPGPQGSPTLKQRPRPSPSCKSGRLAVIWSRSKMRVDSARALDPGPGHSARPAPRQDGPQGPSGPLSTAPQRGAPAAARRGHGRSAAPRRRHPPEVRTAPGGASRTGPRCTDARDQHRDTLGAHRAEPMGRAQRTESPRFQVGTRS